MADSYIQVRTNEADKIAAAKILESLGTNTSAVINMLLKQIIITKSIPFSVSLQSGENIKCVSEYRKADLEAVLKKVPASAEEVWVFGSTVTPFCRPQSDLDICIVGHTTIKEETVMAKAAKCAVDIITQTPEGFAEMSEVPGSVYKDVKEKGLLVYRKGEQIEWK